MPGAGRVGDKAQVQGPGCAHGCPACPHPAQGPGLLGSPDVFINSRFALRVDDIGMHAVCCGMNMWTAKMGAPTVFINNKQAYRKDDMGQSCGGMTKLIEGSSDVLIGDGAGGGAGGKAMGAAAPSIAEGSKGSGGTGTAGGGEGGETSGSAGTYGDNSSGGGGGGGGGGAAAASGSSPAAAPPPEEAASNDKTHHIEITLADADGNPLKDVKVHVKAPDGRSFDKTLDASGKVRIEELTDGTCEVSFPKLNENPRARG